MSKRGARPSVDPCGRCRACRGWRTPGTARRASPVASADSFWIPWWTEQKFRSSHSTLATRVMTHNNTTPSPFPLTTIIHLVWCAPIIDFNGVSLYVQHAYTIVVIKPVLQFHGTLCKWELGALHCAYRRPLFGPPACSAHPDSEHSGWSSSPVRSLCTLKRPTILCLWEITSDQWPMNSQN